MKVSLPENGELALSLCDIGHQDTLFNNQIATVYRRLGALCEEADAACGVRVSKLYVGSYFCDRFFLSLSDEFFRVCSSFCESNRIDLVLVAPIFSQSTLGRGKQRVAELLMRQTPEGAYWFGEAVFNDPAMGLFMRSVKERRGDSLTLNVGRMMAKDPRDPRHAVMAEKPLKLSLDGERWARLRETFDAEVAESDPVAPVLDGSSLGEDVALALHLPHCLITTGHICEAASAILPAEKKFRPGCACTQQCLTAVQVFDAHNLDTGAPVFFTKVGRTVFFENPDCVVDSKALRRVIWTPSDYLHGTDAHSRPQDEEAQQWV